LCQHAKGLLCLHQPAKHWFYGGGEGLGWRYFLSPSQGADVNAVAPNSGLSMLSLASSNGHLNCIATLVEHGAKVDARTKATGNTALHETVLKGPENMACIEALLGHGANARLRNGDGLTPCDLAMKLKHDKIVTCFATYVGAGLMDNLYKYQPSLTL
jgi:ankyrin repeat protein